MTDRDLLVPGAAAERVTVNEHDGPAGAVVFCETPPMAEVRNGYVRARTSMRPSWMRVW
jgi:hypothetical protein